MHELQRLMGHASITTTVEYYTEASGEVKEAVRLALASRGSGSGSAEIRVPAIAPVTTLFEAFAVQLSGPPTLLTPHVSSATDMAEYICD